MKKQVLSYCDYSETIRQFPENYEIAYRDSQGWHMEPDLAANPNIVLHVTKELMKFENKHEKDGLALLARLTPFNAN